MPQLEKSYRVYGQTLATSEDFDDILPRSSKPATMRYGLIQMLQDDLWEEDCEIPVPHVAHRPVGGKPFAKPYRFYFPEIGTYDITPNAIVCYPLPDILPAVTKSDLLGNAFSIWFELQGILALHASAVVIDHRAVGFVSDSGNGKSTLAASLMQVGSPLLADDILPIKVSESGCVALPGYPRLRLWENEAQHFMGHVYDLARVHPEISKRWVPIGAGGWGAFCDAEQPLACLYLPERRDPTKYGGNITITPIPPREALMEFVRFSFACMTVEPIGLQRWRLDSLARLASLVPLRRIVYPSGFDFLPRIREAIVQDLRSAIPTKHNAKMASHAHA